MPTFLDESGDTGHSMHSSRHFRLAAVWVPAEGAAGFRADVQAVRNDLGLKSDYEFKFHGTASRPERRRAFLAAAVRTGFRFAACSIPKTGEKWKKATKADFHYAAVMVLAVTFRPLYLANEARVGEKVSELVTVDDNADPTFLAKVKDAFHTMRSPVHGWPLTSPPRFAPSHTNPLLQLADLVCGSVAAHLDGQSQWFDMIAQHGEGRDTGFGPGISCW